MRAIPGFLSRLTRIVRRNPLPQLGLIAHLVLAFGAVAALAIAANLIAEHGTLIVRTRDVVAIPQKATPPAPVPVRQTPEPQVRLPELPASQGVVETEMLVSTIDRFGAAALNRVAEPSNAWNEQLKAASIDLQRTARAYADMLAATTDDRRGGSRIMDRVIAHELRGTELVRKADSREKQFR